MAINFPTSASLNDTYTYNSKTWKWNGTAWEKSSATETGNTEGNTGEIAYYDTVGSVIKGATAFKYDDSTGEVHFYQGISADKGATFGGVVTAPTFVGALTGNVTGNVSGSSSTTTTAAVATTVTITDNENENESNAIIFTAGGDIDGGNLGLESDGTLTYNPSTGKVTATGFVGTLAGNVTGNASGTSSTVTTAAQPNITSVGILTSLQTSGGISADAGATFAGPVNILGGLTADTLQVVGGATFGGKTTFGGIIDANGGIGLPTNQSIHDGSGNPIFRTEGDRYPSMGDTNSSGNGTQIYVRDTHSIIQLSADTSITLNSPIVKVPDEIQHQSDSDTAITFGTNKISMKVGGQTFLDTVYGAGSGTPIIAPYGITCGIGPAGVYTPHGITCGTLSVGGYWAGEQSTIIGIAIDNGTQTLTTGKKGHRIIPWNCEVTEWTVTSTDTGDVSWAVKWASFSDWPSTASVGGSGFPTFTSAGKSTDTSVNWAKTTFSEGDIMEFEIDGTPTVTNSILFVKIRRTS